MDNKGYLDDEHKVNGHAKGKHVRDVEEEDPWKVTSLKQDFTPWEELDTKGKVLRVLGYFVKVVLVLGFLYLFICSLDFLSSAFRLLGGEAAGRVFNQNEIMSNPIAGLMMGVLVTVLVQSSSTSTSIIVSMVGADLLDIKTAIPIVMGANIGTSVTNTIVAIGQISDKGEFRRAFAGATVHDMFNWLTVIILLPIEIATDYLYHLSDAVVGTLPLETNEDGEQEILKVITEPFTKKIIQVNKKAITNIAKAESIDDIKYDYDKVVLKICCDKPTIDKCCNGAFGDFEDTTIQYYTDAKKEGFCGMNMSDWLPQCLKNPSMASSVASTCATDAWTESTIDKAADYILSPDCSALVQSTDVPCCQNAVDAFMESQSVPRNWTQGCINIMGSCAGTFTLDQCESSLRNSTTREIFDCVKWTQDVIEHDCDDKCDYLFRDLYPTLNDKEIGAIMLVVALFILCVCLVAIVKLLHSVLQGPIATLIKKFVNADFPGVCGYLTGYLAILIGAGLTFVVQSSSIFTSSITPLVGIGVIELDRMYPLTLGSNIGTTTTAILSALASDSDHLRDTLQVAFCHLFFNITGILIFYPFSFMRFPIPMAKFLGNRTAKYRWFAIVYIFLMFFAFPALIFALSIPGWYVLLAVAGPFALIAIIVFIIKVIQAKKPSLLPNKLQNWKFLPKPLRSLEPYDRVMKKIFFCTRFQNEQSNEADNATEMDNHAFDSIESPPPYDGINGHHTKL